MRKYFINDVPFHTELTNLGLFLSNGFIAVCIWCLVAGALTLSGATFSYLGAFIGGLIGVYIPDTYNYIKRVNHGNRVH